MKRNTEGQEGRADWNDEARGTARCRGGSRCVQTPTPGTEQRRGSDDQAPTASLPAHQPTNFPRACRSLRAAHTRRASPRRPRKCGAGPAPPFPSSAVLAQVASAGEGALGVTRKGRGDPARAARPRPFLRPRPLGLPYSRAVGGADGRQELRSDGRGRRDRGRGAGRRRSPGRRGRTPQAEGRPGGVSGGFGPGHGGQGRQRGGLRGELPGGGSAPSGLGARAKRRPVPAALEARAGGPGSQRGRRALEAGGEAVGRNSVRPQAGLRGGEETGGRPGGLGTKA